LVAVERAVLTVDEDKIKPAVAGDFDALDAAEGADGPVGRFSRRQFLFLQVGAHGSESLPSFAGIAGTYFICAGPARPLPGVHGGAPESPPGSALYCAYVGVNQHPAPPNRKRR
jgi:hypothetical protein